MILHVDMDAFYASVEERERPELKDRPVIVGGSPQGRGVVCAANYIARTFGVHSAQPAARAVRLCPQAVFLKPRFDLYSSVSRQIREIFHRYTPLVEPLSLDEAFLDVTGSERLFGDGETIGRAIQKAIRDELSLPCSVGVAPTKFVAKIASDLRKPRGFVVVRTDEVVSFLDPLPVTKIWGVGATAERHLAALGITKIGDLRIRSAESLVAAFGKHGRKLWNLANGIDHRAVVPDHAAKQISHETTFGQDITDLETLRAWVSELAANVGRRLRRHHRTAQAVVLKLRYDDFTTITRSHSLPDATDATSTIFRAADELLRTRLPRRRLSVRLIGVGVTGLSSVGGQKLLFPIQEEETRPAIDAVADAIAQKFGRDALRSGLSFGLERPERLSPPKT
ncbi:MAG: DNA polymerase IV [Planctomycetota bacterium]|nr:DNA polymerase IV [Planctomycetota bacterium]